MSFSKAVLLYSVILHCQITSSSWPYHINKDGNANSANVMQGVNYLLYPFCCLLIESYLKKFNFTKWSCLLVLISSIPQLIVGILDFKGINIHGNDYVASLVMLTIFTGTFGLSMFEANAIRFGMNQMLDASSEQLSSFIHWYFWCSNAGILIIFYVYIVVYFSTSQCQGSFTKTSLGLSLFVSSCVQIIGSFFGLVFARWFKLSESQNSENPIKLVYKVLAYSYKHKYPERRSAFTYWENDIPSRIDLGKDKYGGPFTYEQVEDVKTFFRLLLLMMSLFGFHLLGDGYSLVSYIIKTTGCPIVPLMTIYVNPQQIPTVFVLVTIPLYQVAKKRIFRFIPNMLSRIWIGLYIALIAESFQVIVGIFLSGKKSFCLDNYKHSYVFRCLFSILVKSDGSCVPSCTEPTSHSYVAWIAAVFVLILYGISYVLVFMTTVEFISAQSPNSTKGLLIGIWYSMISIKYIFVNSLDLKYLRIESWSVYNGCKGVGLFVSIGFFSFVAKNYRYREKNEVVNSQAMIEEQYERELLLKDSSSSFEVHSID